MTDFTKLIDWYEDRFEDDPDSFSDTLDLNDLSSSMYDFGVRETLMGKKSLAERQLLPVGFNKSNVADDIVGRISSNIKFIDVVEKKNDLGFYDKLISKRIEPVLAKSLGISLAKERFRRNADQESYNFLRKYSFQTLGGLTRQELRRTEGFRQMF